MKDLASVLAKRKVRPAPHETAASANEILECLKPEPVQKPYTYWLGVVKRSGKSYGDVMAIVKKAKDLPAKYNRGGYVTNQLKKPKAAEAPERSSQEPN